MDVDIRFAMATSQTRDNNVMHAKPVLRVFLKWMIAGSGSVITDVIPLNVMAFLPNKRILLAVCFVLVAAFAFGAGYQMERVKLANSIGNSIDQLALCEPKGVSKLEWLILVYWTHNLHGNAALQTNQSLTTLKELDFELHEILLGNPDKATIDQLWDRYAAISDGGASYKTKFKSQRDFAMADAAKHGQDYFDKSSYYDFFDYVKSGSNN